MSNAMSRSKSRWKGALLATVAGAVVTPLAAKASMSVGVYLNPIGTGLQTTELISPDYNNTAIPLYVYATVTGNGAVTPVSGNTGGAPGITSGDFDGLQYLYYNLLATGGNAGGISGGFNTSTGAALNATLGFDSTENNDGGGSNTSGGAAAQKGTVQLGLSGTLAAGATTVAVGSPAAWNVSGPATTPVSSSNMTDFAKPRAGSAVWSNYQSYNGSNYVYANDGTNIIIGTGSNGLATNQVAFLVEKFNYTPSAFAPSLNSSSIVSTSFSIQNPAAVLNSPSYQVSNSFNDSSTSTYTYNSSTGSPLASITSSNYSIGHSVTIVDTIPGDANLDGKVDVNDLLILAQNYNHTGTDWAQGDFSGNGNTDVNSLLVLAQHYNQNIGITPAQAAELTELGGPGFLPAWNAALAEVNAASVPEPGSLTLLGLGAAGALVRRRKASR